jgi:hypothetical protein
MKSNTQNLFLIKRSPSFSNKGLIEKKNAKIKGYSETRISKDKGAPLPKNFKPGDMIYVAEKGWGIYAAGLVEEVSDLFTASSVDSIIAFIVNNKKKDEVYWLDKLTRFHKAKQENTGASIQFKYQEYTVNQKLLKRPLPLVGGLSRLSKPGFAASMIQLTKDEATFIQNPVFRDNEFDLSENVPYALKMDVWGFFNTRMAVQHFIDVDHFVPKSAGGPGNIIENLVPIGLGLNRYKSNKIPRGFFEEVEKHDQLKKLITMNHLPTKGDFISTKQAIHDAFRINKAIAAWGSIKDIRAFYRAVLSHHFRDYVRIIDEYRNSRGVSEL